MLSSSKGQRQPLLVLQVGSSWQLNVSVDPLVLGSALAAVSDDLQPVTVMPLQKHACRRCRHSCSMSVPSDRHDKLGSAP